MNKNRIKLLLILTLAVAMADCGRENASPETTPTQPIVLGTVYNVSGFQAVLDLPSSRGSQLAAQHINQTGGVLGRHLSLSAYEGDSMKDSLREGVEALIANNPDMVALLGLSDTDMVLAAAPAAAQRGRVFLTSGATSPQLPGQVPDFLFLACFGDNVQAAAGAEWAFHNLGARKACVLYDSGKSYPRLLQRYFVQRFSELGGRISDQKNIDPHASDADVPDIGDSDIVFLSVETAEDAARWIPQIRQSGFEGPILGGDGYDAASVWTDHADIGNVYFTTHVYLGADSSNPKVCDFLAAYTAAYPRDAVSAFAALGYDAVGLIATAITNVGRADYTTVASGLSAIEAYQGVTGTISYTEGRHIPRKSVSILEVSGGEEKFVQEILPESVPEP